MPQSSNLPQSLETVAEQGGASIASSILARVKEFPRREKLLSDVSKSGLDSVPAEILWGGLEDEAAPVFVVYKLLHEAFSVAPQFFRRFITEIMAAQPDRFSTVFSRETLWSMVARGDAGHVGGDWASPAMIRHSLEKLNRKSFWRRSDDELEREAEGIAKVLNKEPKHRFRDGVEALRRLQSERATGLTQGNLMLFVPAKLNQFTDEVTDLGMRGQLPGMKELNDKVFEIIRDPLTEGRHQSIPIDVLFTDLEGDTFECFLLARATASEPEQRKLRIQALLVRYFLKHAFSAYDMNKLRVRLAFYLDPRKKLEPLSAHARLFHEEEQISFDEFWGMVAGDKNGAQLIHKTRAAAVAALVEGGLMATIRSHFARDRGQEAPKQKSLFPGEESKGRPGTRT